VRVRRIEPEPEPVPEPEPSANGKRKREQLDSKLDVRMSAEQRQELEAWAKHNGKPLAEYVRDSLAMAVWFDKAPVLEKQERDRRDDNGKQGGKQQGNKPEDVLARFKRALKD
jgi:hypothetical protein